ncbi:MAG: pyridoxamine 5'-phosphate oxidase family protein [Terriglobia bacterium]|jgi:nitroimidazol reductase NimA-like FMN-containing flavoprotein (pyridoxamine 5'-phosphate oxidase superfamily)|nr:pyridoxamine 5'-phosphate oxidase family protein [Terriglobia bacterium]
MITTERSQLRRLPNRGSHETETIHRILDAGFLAHVGFSVDDQPFVIPTLYGREGNHLFLHGSAASRMLKTLEKGVPACVTVTLVDGLVLARSAFHHSINYRSVVAFGTCRSVAETGKAHALNTISEHLIRGRWNEVRPPNEKELRATTVLQFEIEEASAKVRTGPPADDEEDYALPVWAGVLPLRLVAETPVPDTRMTGQCDVPDHVKRFQQNHD